MERRRSVVLFLLCSFCIGMWLVGCSTNGDPTSNPRGPATRATRTRAWIPRTRCLTRAPRMGRPSSIATAWQGTSGTWGRRRAWTIFATRTLAGRSPMRCRARATMPTTTSFACACEDDTFWVWAGNTGTCEDPCDPDPCGGIQDAIAGTCEGFSADVFTCGCQTGYLWDSGTRACVEDLCSPDPCALIDDADPGSCTMPTATSFECGCDAGFFWDALTETCEDPCDPDPCALIADATAGSCDGLDADDFTCGCDAGFFWDGDDRHVRGSLRSGSV